MTYAVTGSLKATVIAAITPSSNNFIVAGIIGGLASKAQGGNFRHGFTSAAAGNLLGGKIDVGNPYANVIISAIVGGTVSKLTGGKFSNGAQTWAFQSAVQQDWSSASQTEVYNVVGSGGDGTNAANSKTANAFLEKEAEKAGQLFCQSKCSTTTEDDAHMAAAERYLGASLAAVREVTWRVYKLKDGTYSFTYPNLGDLGDAFAKLPPIDYSLDFVSAGHTHWDRNNKFSRQDWHLITQKQRRGHGIKLYLASKNGQLQYSTPRMARKLGIKRGAHFDPPRLDFSGIVVPGNISTKWD